MFEGVVNGNSNCVYNEVSLFPYDKHMLRLMWLAQLESCARGMDAGQGCDSSLDTIAYVSPLWWLSAPEGCFLRTNARLADEPVILFSSLNHFWERRI